MTIDQQIQIARAVLADNSLRREFVKRARVKAGLPPEEIAAMLRRVASLHHSLDQPHPMAGFSNFFRAETWRP